MNAMKIAKSILGVFVVLVLFLLVAHWWGDYRGATATTKAGKGSTETSSSATDGTNASPATGTETQSDTNAQPQATAGQVLIVSVDGLNFRGQPDAQSKALRGLSKGERVTLIATEGDWYKVQDSKGVVGYITSNNTYTEKAQ